MINYARKFGISREPREVETPSMSISIGGKVGRRKKWKKLVASRSRLQKLRCMPFPESDGFSFFEDNSLSRSRSS